MRFYLAAIYLQTKTGQWVWEIFRKGLTGKNDAPALKTGIKKGKDQFCLSNYCVIIKKCVI